MPLLLINEDECYMEHQVRERISDLPPVKPNSTLHKQPLSLNAAWRTMLVPSWLANILERVFKRDGWPALLKSCNKKIKLAYAADWKVISDHK
jgi:hypothetical protein